MSASLSLSVEDLIGLSAAGWTLGETRCVACGGYHRVWGLLRAAGVVGGTAVDTVVLAPLLDTLVRPGARVLIAGAADAAIVALLMTTAARPLDITVVDICSTPLRIIERLEAQDGLTVRTLRTDLAEMTTASAFDLILSHSMLPFVDGDRRIAVVRALGRALAPGGRAVIVVRTAPALSAADREAHDKAWLDRAWRRIDGSGVPLPGPRSEIDTILVRFAAMRRGHLGGLQTAEEVVDLLEAGGLRLISSHAGGDSTAVTVNGAAHVRRSHVFVCA